MSATPFWGSPAMEGSSGGSIWDQFYLNDVTLPGAAQIKVTKGAARKLDTRSAAGSDGWRLVDKGAQPVEFTVTLTLWDADHWDTWDEYSSALTERLGAGRERRAIDVSRNPVLRALAVDEAYLTEVGGLDIKSDGRAEVELKFVQYKRPSRRAATHRVAPSGPATVNAAQTSNALLADQPASTNANGTRPARVRNTAP